MLKKLLISVFIYAFVLTGCSTTGDSKSDDGAYVEDRRCAVGPSNTGSPGVGPFPVGVQPVFRARYAAIGWLNSASFAAYPGYRRRDSC